MPSYSLFQGSYDRAQQNAVDDFRRDQKKLVRVPGPHTDPFGDQAPEDSTWRGIFEALPKPYVAWAFERMHSLTPHGSCIIVFNARPTNDEKVCHGAPDWLASTDPSWWVAAAARGGLPVSNYAVKVGESVVLNW